MGLTNSPAHFARLMSCLLRGLKCCLTFLMTLCVLVRLLMIICQIYSWCLIVLEQRTSSRSRRNVSWFKLKLIFRPFCVSVWPGAPTSQSGLRLKLAFSDKWATWNYSGLTASNAILRKTRLKFRASVYCYGNLIALLKRSMWVIYVSRIKCHDMVLC